MIVQQILAAGGPGMELAARHSISIPPWLCRAALGHGAPGASGSSLALSMARDGHTEVLGEFLLSVQQKMRRGRSKHCVCGMGMGQEGKYLWPHMPR